LNHDGIATEDIQWCFVDKFKPDSYAKQCGIKVGDWIVDCTNDDSSNKRLQLLGFNQVQQLACSPSRPIQFSVARLQKYFDDDDDGKRAAVEDKTEKTDGTIPKADVEAKIPSIQKDGPHQEVLQGPEEAQGCEFLLTSSTQRPALCPKPAPPLTEQCPPGMPPERVPPVLHPQEVKNTTFNPQTLPDPPIPVPSPKGLMEPIPLQKPTTWLPALSPKPLPPLQGPLDVPPERVPPKLPPPQVNKTPSKSNPPTPAPSPKRWIQPGKPPLLAKDGATYKRPKGRAPLNHIWDKERGQWLYQSK
jgi:hypothetical protein